ncbi:MAG: TVP38/TMEM64 family protein [Spirochaetaceae bacterium]|nr:TVP38/TMEM64 family protein [Spirochaetaceae bacterium]
MKKKMKIITALIIPIVLGVVILISAPMRQWLLSNISLLTSLDIQKITEYIRSLGLWGPLISFILMLLQSVIAPLPAFVLTFANAIVFGWVWGALLSWTSAMAGAALCFGIARFYGRDVVSSLTSIKSIESVDVFFEQHGKYAIFIARLLPFVSFDIVSYAAGLTAIKFISFFIATGSGQLPATIIYSYVGGMLTGGAKAFVTALLILFALSAFIVLLKKIVSEKKEDIVRNENSK